MSSCNILDLLKVLTTGKFWSSPKSTATHSTVPRPI